MFSAISARQLGVSPIVIREIDNQTTWRHVNLFDFDALFVDRQIETA